MSGVAEGAHGRSGGEERVGKMISFGSDRMFYFLRNACRSFPFLWNGSHGPSVPNKLRRFLSKATKTFKNPMKKLCSKQGLREEGIKHLKVLEKNIRSPCTMMVNLYFLYWKI
jgi:hypothetical protein